MRKERGEGQEGAQRFHTVGWAEQQEQDTEAVDAGENLDCMTPFVVQRDSLLSRTDCCSGCYHNHERVIKRGVPFFCGTVFSVIWATDLA